MRLLLLLTFFAAAVVEIPFAGATSTGTSYHRNRLVAFLVIDQFRADYLTRFKSQFKPGGFRYLMEKGAYFPFARQDLLQAKTGPGHAALLTGAYPARSGIPLNEWYDSERGKSLRCVEDTSGGRGVSPRNLLSTTVGDELKNAGYPSRVISIAYKDYAAILLGGQHPDFCLWFDATSGKWASSLHYTKDGKLPAWAAELNTEMEKQKKSIPPLILPKTSSGFSLPDTLFVPLAEISKYNVRDAYTELSLTELAAEKAVRSLKLGHGKATDFIAISFSSHDRLGHTYSPNSQEMENMTVAEDQVLSRFFGFLDKNVPGGLKDVLVVLTADHGIPPNPEWLQSQGVPAGRIDTKDLVQRIENRLNKKFGNPKQGSWVASSIAFNFFMNPHVITKTPVDHSLIEQEAKAAVENTPGIFKAFTATDYRNRKLPPGPFERQILRSYFPGRSGDLVLIPLPFHFDGKTTVDHMSAYPYDQSIPLIFAGPHIKSGTYATQAESVDIAPTLAWLLGTVPPTMSEGRVLSEIVNSNENQSGAEKHGQNMEKASD